MKLTYRLLANLALLVVTTGVTLGQTDTLTILHVNDTHSTLAPIGPRDPVTLKGSLGGIARATTMIGMTKMTEPNVLTLHAGDLFIGDMFFNKYFGVAELQMMLSLGFDAMAVGNHEFDLMPSTLKTALDSAFVQGSFPLLSANLNLEASEVQGLKQYIKPYTVKDMGAFKVGIFGLTTPATMILSQPAPAVVDTDFISAAAAMVDTLSAKNCSVILCLSHLGLTYDQLLASYVPGIHAIIGGHDHYELESAIPVENPAGDTTWIVQANAFYLDIGKLRFTVNGSTVKFLDYQLIPLDGNVPEEETMAGTVDGLIQEIEATYGPMYTQQLSYAADDFAEVADSLTVDGYHDTPVGRLVTDAFRDLSKTDIAIEVGGSTAQPLYKGPIVGADVFRMVGYGFNTDNGLGYRLATFTMTGEALLMGLEWGLSTIEENDEYFIQASGLVYWYAPHHPPYQRVVSATIGGQPLDPFKSYTVTANEFVPMFLNYLTIPVSNVHVMPDTTEYQAIVWYLAGKDTIPTSSPRVLVGVRNQDNRLPKFFALLQNYPNPFNPATTIEFDLPERSRVRLEVYDILGRVVATIVDNVLEAGHQTVRFDASRLSSGVYIYRISAGSFVQTKRMVLIR